MVTEIWYSKSALTGGFVADLKPFHRAIVHPDANLYGAGLLS